MKIFSGVIVLAAALVGVLAAADRFDLMRVRAGSGLDVRELEDAGCVVNGPGQDGRWLVEVPFDKIPTLERAGWEMETFIPDVRAYYARNAQDARYHTYTEMKDSFRLMAQNNPGFVRFETLGYASNDSLLFALKITDNPSVDEDEPALLFEGAVHGDEKCGTEAVYAFAVYLVQNYGVDPTVTYWIDTREIWIECPVNPYGHIVGNRGNANGEDCNRDFGFMWYYETGGQEPFIQPESRLMVQQIVLKHTIAHWTSYHGGTYMISTPWSYTPFGARDSMELQYLAQQWHNITGYPYGPGYRVMYKINGASKDYGYGALGAICWTVEDCIYKTPPAESLEPIITRERNAMKMMLANVDRGIRGIVSDSATGAPIRARVRPMPIDFPSFCDSIGDYHRYLRPGTYSVVFEANGYRSKAVNNVVVTQDTVTRLDAQLARDTSLAVSLHRFIAGRGVSDEAIVTTPDWCLGPHDGRRFSMGRGGMAIFDFGQRVFNLTGNDFTVYEDDADPEGYRVEVADDWTGPWTSLGRDTGTSGFDLARGGITTCRYVKIVDDSSATSGATAGFDLDAVEAVMSSVAALVLEEKTVLDSPPGGNGDGKLDPGETAGLVLSLKNVGRLSAIDVHAALSTADSFITVFDSTGTFGTIEPDSVRANWGDRFGLSASAACPREHQARMKLRMWGGYQDSLEFTLVVGELLATDPIPDGPRQPPLYWAYDNGDTAYVEHPDYDWVEIRSQGTRIPFPSNDDVVPVNLPTAFGPLSYYGQSYSQVSVSADGWIACGNYTQSNYTNTVLPSSAAPPAAIFINWDDLYPDLNGQGYVYWYHDTANHRFIVEYDSVAYWNAQTTRDKFEAIVYDTTVATPSGDNVIVAQYKTAAGYSSSTVGIQDPTSAIGIQCLYNDAYNRGCAPLAAGRAVKYTSAYTTGVAEHLLTPSAQRFTLEAKPNPWSRGEVALRMSLGQPGAMRVAVFDALGRQVRMLFESGPEPLAAGTHRLFWDGRDARGRAVGRGVYLIRLDGGPGRAAAVKLVRLN